MTLSIEKAGWARAGGALEAAAVRTEARPAAAACAATGALPTANPDTTSTTAAIDTTIAGGPTDTGRRRPEGRGKLFTTSTMLGH